MVPKEGDEYVFLIPYNSPVPCLNPWFHYTVLVVTNSYFTYEARRLAKSTGVTCGIESCLGMRS